MLRLGSIRLIRSSVCINFSRTMSKFSVRCVDNEESLQITVEYADSGSGSASRIFNACRPKIENIENSLTRLAQNINKHLNKKKKKKNSDIKEVTIELFESDGVTKICDPVSAEEGFSHGNVVQIVDTKYTVDVNPPCCLGIVIPQSIMVGFPLYPKVNAEFCNLEESEFIWEKLKYKVDNTTENSKSRKQSSSTVEERKDICRTLSYTPSNDDVGYCLSFTCIPKSGDRSGKSFTVEAKYEVTVGPGVCPFETRHLYTQKQTGQDEIRVISYNILADIYADQDFSRDVLFSYCPAYALDIDYRKPLIIKELTGYNGDIICLQEVDAKVFKSELGTALTLIGFEGFFKEKGGEVREGSAIFIRKSKFRVVAEYGEQIKDILETNPVCLDIIKKAYAIPALKEMFQTRTTVIHIVALEPVHDPEKIILVANTHLYFHPNAGHIRMLQVLVAMRFIESLLKQYKKQRPSLIFCGDFNSTPQRAIYEFMTTKSVKEDNVDWKDGGDDSFAPGMNFSHTLNIGSACGTPAYTNYTEGFNGHLDYIYYDKDSFDVSQVIPPPDHKDVEFHTALPSIVFPSDHIAQICDLKYKP